MFPLHFNSFLVGQSSEFPHLLPLKVVDVVEDAEVEVEVVDVVGNVDEVVDEDVDDVVDVVEVDDVEVEVVSTPYTALYPIFLAVSRLSTNSSEVIKSRVVSKDPIHNIKKIIIISSFSIFSHIIMCFLYLHS